MGLGSVGRFLRGKEPAWAGRHPWRFVLLDTLATALIAWLGISVTLAVTGGFQEGSLNPLAITAGIVTGRVAYHAIRRGQRAGTAVDGPDDSGGG